MLKSRTHSFADETLTLMIAFAMIMPWAAISTAESAFSGAASLAQESGAIKVAVASDFTQPLLVAEENGTVAAHIEAVVNAVTALVH